MTTEKQIIKLAASCYLAAIEGRSRREKIDGIAKELTAAGVTFGDGAKPETFAEFCDDLHAWANATFGVGRKVGPCLAHLREEVDEVIASPNDGSEYADCLILLCQAAMIQGLDILDEAKKKMMVNKARDWGGEDADGIVRHAGRAEPDERGADSDHIDALEEAGVDLKNIAALAAHNAAIGVEEEAIRNKLIELGWTPPEDVPCKGDE